MSQNMEERRWIVVVKFGDSNSHVEQTTSFGYWSVKENAYDWVYQVYEGQIVIAEVIPFNVPFDPIIMKRANLTVVPPNDEDYDEHQPTEQDEWLDYDPEC